MRPHTRRTAGVLVYLLLWATSNPLACAPRSAFFVPGAEHVSSKAIIEVQADHTAEWMSLPGVVGVAIGEHQGRACIKVFVAGDPAVVRQQLPTSVEGYPVVVEPSGPFRAR